MALAEPLSKNKFCFRKAQPIGVQPTSDVAADVATDGSRTSGQGKDAFLLNVSGVCSRFWYCLWELAKGLPPLLEEAPPVPDLAIAPERAFIQACRSFAECAARCVLHICPR